MAQATNKAENEKLLPGASFYELAGADTGNTASRRYKVPFTDLEKFLRSYLGYSAVAQDLNTGRKILRRWMPYRNRRDRLTAYPGGPSALEMDLQAGGVGEYAVRHNVRPWAYRGQQERGPTGGAFPPPFDTQTKYEWADVTLSFETVRWKFGLVDTLAPPNEVGQYTQEAQPQFETDRWCYKDIRPTNQQLTYKANLFEYERPGDKKRVQVPFPITVPIPYAEVIVTWKRIPLDAIPYTAIDKCRGRANKLAMVLPAEPPPKVYDPETLIFMTYQLVWAWQPDGVRCLDVVYYFNHRKLPIPYVSGNTTEVGGWNHYLFSDAKVRRLKRPGSEEGPYLVEDFAGLFKPEP